MSDVVIDVSVLVAEPRLGSTVGLHVFVSALFAFSTFRQDPGGSDAQELLVSTKCIQSDPSRLKIQR